MTVQSFTHYPKKTLLVFMLVYLFCVAFFVILFLHDPHIDFVPLYIVGNLWRTGGPAWYYDYQILDQGTGYILITPKYIDDYAVKLGFQSKYSTTLYLYFPTFIPVFSLFSLLPYNMSANLMMALSILVIMLTLKIIISETSEIRRSINVGGTAAESSAKAGALAILIILFSNPARMAIGWGQFTPYLFTLTFMSLYLEERSQMRRSFSEGASLMRPTPPKRLRRLDHGFSDGAGKSIAAGLLLAVATWCKFFPGLLVLYWLFRRDFRSIAAFLAGCALILAAGLLMFDREVIHAYFELLKVMGRGVTFCAPNQSIEAFFMRFQHPIQQMLGIVTYLVSPRLKIIALIIKTLIIFSWFFLIMRLKSREKVAGAPNYNTHIAGYYLMAVMVMLLPISWTHYYLFLIPLTFYMLDLFRDKRLNIPVLMKVVFVIAVIFTFLPPGVLRYVADFLNATIGRKVSLNVVKFLFSSHLVGGLMMLLLAQLTLSAYVRTSADLRRYHVSDNSRR